MFRTHGEIEQSLVSAGMSEVGARLAASLARPSVKFETRYVDESDIPIGASKIGGDPDLPDGTLWPIRPPYADAATQIAQRREALKAVSFRRTFWEWLFRKRRITNEELGGIDSPAHPRPLTFLAQVDLGAIAAAGPIDVDLPRSGRLLLFYDTEAMPFGDTPSDDAGFALIYDPSPVDALSRRGPPDEIADAAFDGVAVDMQWTLAPPMLDDLGEEDWTRLDAWFADTAVCTGHRLGGHPVEIQSPLDNACVLVSHGFYASEDGAADAARAGIDVEAERGDWVFLLQIDSEDDARMMWGDCGRLYLWIHRDDLAARHFERARLFLRF